MSVRDTLNSNVCVQNTVVQTTEFIKTFSEMKMQWLFEDYNIHADYCK